MTQPVGRVLDMPAELRFWMRANPLVCVGDLLHYLVRIILIDARAEPGRPWRRVFRAALADRFRDTDWSAPRPKFEQAAVGRWALLLLGGIPCQTIKLMAMRGIPATQAFALMFVVALVLGEGLNVFAERSLRRDGSGNNYSTDPPVSPPQPSSERQKSLSYYLFVGTHELSHWWLVKNLLTAAEIAISIKNRGSILVSVWSTSIASIVGLLHLILNITQLWSPTAFYESLLDWLSVDGPQLIGIYPFAILTFGLCSLLSEFYDSRHRGNSNLLALSFIFFGLGGVVAISTCLLCWLGWSALRNLSQSRLGQVLGLPRGTSELCFFISFLAFLLLVVLSYAYTFNSAGTANPTWLGIFG